ncbi:endonuclease V [Salarchaeum japonicum]|uniref:Endonuclease V n=1 Tax=Salarchaeum japonicum TaxID=555573 RepID=A0AAV3T1N2_9EURY|nr:endonuclease V [Salarchaeum japonicum]
MEVARPEYVPDPSFSREEMEALQDDIAADAAFADDHGIDPDALRLTDTVEDEGDYDPDGGPVVVGVDQAFTDDESVSAVVAIQDGRVVARETGRAPLEIPYVPGLLAFREGRSIVTALDSLSVPADLLVLDGSGRIHFRQAGIATHVGVVFDAPALGVAKNLLCGTPRRSLDDYYREGTRIPIEATDRVSAPIGTVIGHAFQSRQYPNPEKRHVNPLIVSPGHRVSAETTVDFVEALCAGYKLPEPTRLADAAADRVK